MPNDATRATTTPLPEKNGWPLMRAIYQHRADWNAYLAVSWDDDNAPPIFRHTLKTLEEWDQPAASQIEAAEALRCAIEFYEAGDSDVIPAMMKAALGYLTGGVA